MPDPSPLSPAGEQRRAAILRLAQAEAGRRRRRRRTVRAAATGAVAVLLTLLLTHHWPTRHPVQPIAVRPAPTPATPPVAVVPTPPVMAPRRTTRQIAIQYIKTEPNLARRLAAPPQKPTWRRLSDDELIQGLADAGRPAGLAWIDGRELILYRTPQAAIGQTAHDRRIPRAP